MHLLRKLTPLGWQLTDNQRSMFPAEIPYRMTHSWKHFTGSYRLDKRQPARALHGSFGAMQLHHPRGSTYNRGWEGYMPTRGTHYCDRPTWQRNYGTQYPSDHHVGLEPVSWHDWNDTGGV